MTECHKNARQNAIRNVMTATAAFNDHTPGPWVIVDHDNGPFDFHWTIRNQTIEAITTEPLDGDYRGAIVAETHCLPSRGDSIDRALANARLIAACPDLLAALELCLGYAGVGIIANELGKHVKLEQIRDAARAALGEARKEG